MNLTARRRHAPCRAKARANAGLQVIADVLLQDGPPRCVDPFSEHSTGRPWVCSAVRRVTQAGGSNTGRFQDRWTVGSQRRSASYSSPKVEHRPISAQVDRGFAAPFGEILKPQGRIQAGFRTGDRAVTGPFDDILKPEGRRQAGFRMGGRNRCRAVLRDTGAGRPNAGRLQNR